MTNDIYDERRLSLMCAGGDKCRSSQKNDEIEYPIENCFGIAAL